MIRGLKEDILTLRVKTMDAARKTLQALASGDAAGILKTFMQAWREYTVESAREQKMVDMERQLLDMKMSYESTTKMTLMTLCGGSGGLESAQMEGLMLVKQAFGLWGELMHDLRAERRYEKQINTLRELMEKEKAGAAEIHEQLASG